MVPGERCTFVGVLDTDNECISRCRALVALVNDCGQTGTPGGATGLHTFLYLRQVVFDTNQGLSPYTRAKTTLICHYLKIGVD